MINLKDIRHSAILETPLCKCGKCSKCDKIKNRRKKNVIHNTGRIRGIFKEKS
jgi:hypothetical protein